MKAMMCSVTDGFDLAMPRFRENGSVMLISNQSEFHQNTKKTMAIKFIFTNILYVSEMYIFIGY